MAVKEFDDIYNNEIIKRHDKHEIQRFSKRKNRERGIGAGRHFKLDIKKQVSYAFDILSPVHYLHISRFLFDLDQSNICRDIQKIEY